MGNWALKSLVVPRYRLFAEDLGLTVGEALPPKSTDTWACLFARWGGKMDSAPPDGFDFQGKMFTRLKSLPPSFTRLVKSSITTKQVCAFRQFQCVFSRHLNVVKSTLKRTQNRSKLSGWIWVLWGVFYAQNSAEVF